MAQQPYRLRVLGRETAAVERSSFALTHYTVKNVGAHWPNRSNAGDGDYKLKPTSPGSDKDKAALDEIIARVNEFFVGDLTEGDKLLYVNNAIKGKLLECEVLIEQAVNNTKEQFGNSPDLDARILDAVMEALSAFTSMSKQALES